MTMATTRSYRSVTLGVVVAALLVLLLGNPPAQAALDDLFSGREGGGNQVTRSVLRFGAYPFDTDRDFAAWVIFLLLYLAILAVLLAVARAGGPAGLTAFLLGWGVTMLAAGFGAALAQLLSYAIQYPGEAGPSMTGLAMQSLFGGAAYGLLVGWIVGIAVMAGSRRRV
jgi:hypothetical protein